MKMIQKILMASEFQVNLLKDCYFEDAEGKEAAVEDGALVSIKGLRDHELYAGMKDLNARKCTAFDAEAPMFGFVDYVGVSHGDIMNVTYRIGDKTAGCYPMAGEGTRVRMPLIGDEFWLGDENFSGTPAIGAYAAPEAGKTTLLIGDKPASGLCVEIEDVKDLIMGQVNEGSKLYRCRVIQL